MPVTSIYDAHPHVYEAVLLSERGDIDTHTTSLTSLFTEHNVPSDGVVLDVGCGTGVHLSTLSPTYTRIGVDIARGILTHGAVTAQHSFTPIQGDMHTLPLQESSVDVITCLYSTLNHVSSSTALQRVVREWRRVLTDDGVVIIEFTPCPSEHMNTGSEFHESFTVDTDEFSLVALQSSKINAGDLELETAYTLTDTHGDFTRFTDRQTLTLLSSDHVTKTFTTHDFTVTQHDDVLPLQTFVATR